MTSDKIPTWVVWIAQDADGAWWGYEAEPHMHDHGWYENEVGRSIKLAERVIPGKPTDHWSASLRKLASP